MLTFTAEGFAIISVRGRLLPILFLREWMASFSGVGMSAAPFPFTADTLFCKFEVNFSALAASGKTPLVAKH